MVAEFIVDLLSRGKRIKKFIRKPLVESDTGGFFISNNPTKKRLINLLTNRNREFNIKVNIKRRGGLSCILSLVNL